MKKTRFLVLILVVSVMLMGAGYALWNEVIPLHAEVNSTYLNIGLEKEVETTYAYNTFDPKAYGTTCEVRFADNGRGKTTNSTSATVDFKNIFPGVTQTATIKFINDSKIPVQLQQVVYSEIAAVVPNALLEATEISISSKEKDAGAFYPLSILKGKTYVVGGNPDIIPDVVLEPGEFLTYIIRVNLPVEADNTTQLQSFSFDITHTWQQQTDVVKP